MASQSVCKTYLALGAPQFFPPQEVAAAKAVACERPAILKLPLSRFSTADVCDWLLEEQVVASVSVSTVWRWLHQDAIRPWFYRSWLFRRDPRFLEKAGPVLDLCTRAAGKARRWDRMTTCSALMKRANCRSWGGRPLR